MMNTKIKGLGNDIISVDRIKNAIDRQRETIIDRIFTKKEQEYCSKFQDPYPRYAGRFAAKESVVKALGTGFGDDILWHDVEISHDEKGKPIVILSDKLKKRFNSPNILVSLSHCKEYATANAIWID